MSGKKKHEENGVSDMQLEGLTQSLFAAIQQYYETETGQLAFREFDESGLDVSRYFETQQGQLAFNEFKESMKKDKNNH